MAFYLPNIKPRFFDENGDPLAGGKLWSYIAGTSTPLSTFSDMDEETPNTNPVILDANGEADIFLANAIYKLVLTDSADVPQWTQDDVEPWEESEADSGGGSAWSEHAITDNMSATDLEEQTVDFALYSSAVYDCEILRGTTVIANGTLCIQNLNGTGRVLVGDFIAEEAHGVTFSVSQAALVVQLRAATDAGAGAGTIKLSRRLVPV